MPPGVRVGKGRRQGQRTDLGLINSKLTKGHSRESGARRAGSLHAKLVRHNGTPALMKAIIAGRGRDLRRPPGLWPHAPCVGPGSRGDAYQKPRPNLRRRVMTLKEIQGWK